MTEGRQPGRFEWYAHEKNYGIIRGDDAREYFVHFSNMSLGLVPYKGMRVSFRSRPRTHGKKGVEAYDVVEAKEIDQVSQLPVKSPSKNTSKTAWLRKIQNVSQNKPSSKTKKTSAAEEALRRKRLQKRGLIAEEIETMPPGTRIRHGHYGPGTIKLASKQTVSIQFDAAPLDVLDFQRRDLTNITLLDDPPITSSQPEPRDMSSQRSKTGLGNLMHQLSNDVKEKLTDEGWDEVDHIYFSEDAADPTIALRPLQIDKRVAEAFRKSSNITEFYSHQVQTREALVAGKNVLIATPTASGKTEAYNPTIIETLINHPNARALYVFPLVALGLDQVQRLKRVNTELPSGDQLLIGIYNSSVDRAEKRRTMPLDNRIVIITPESLHYILLPKPYPNWQRYFRDLRYIVLDEAHLYRGVLGVNMANIVRRVLARCVREGNKQTPQIIVSSATVAKPRQLAQQLTGLRKDSFAIINESGAPVSRRHFLITRSDIHDIESLCTDLLSTKIIDNKKGDERPVRTIVFMRSINGVKTMTSALRRQLKRSGQGDLVSAVEGYYSDKSDKNDVLIQLRQGKIRCLFTTTALMAGIDIGGLDVSIVKNFPRLVMDARQMFGRAGRAGEGAVIFVGNPNDVFDQFYFERPQLLFSGPTEDVIANPENPHLLEAHLKCAAQTSPLKYDREGPLDGRTTWLFGQMGQILLDILSRNGTLRVWQGAYHLDEGAPHDEQPLNSIRSMETEMFSLRDEDTNRELEKKRRTTAFRDAHPGAITWVSGSPYRVISLDQGDQLILCQKANTTLRTQGIQEVSIDIREVDPLVASPDMNFTPIKDVDLNSGSVTVTTSVSEYIVYEIKSLKQCRNRSCRHTTTNLEASRCLRCGSSMRFKQEEEFREKCVLTEEPPLRTDLNTHAAWLDISVALKNAFEREFWPRWEVERKEKDEIFIAVEPTFAHAVHSVLHALLKAFPERLRCDHDEIGGTYKYINQEDTELRIYIYDNFPGGLGLAVEFADDPYPLLEDAMQVIERCTCIDDQGCPVCLARFDCEHFNDFLSKLAGRFLLRTILGIDTTEVIDDLMAYVEMLPAGSQVLASPAVSYDDVPF